MSSNMAAVDLLIVGGGPAGLSAALVFSRVKRSALVYDSGTYRNAGVEVSHTIPGNDGSSPAEYRRAVRKEIEDGYPWTEFRDDKIVSLKTNEDGKFEATDGTGRKVIARKLVLATGLSDELEDVSGIRQAWGKRLVHCVFCHGTETREQPFAFLLSNGPNGKNVNPMLVASVFKMWRSLDHSKTYLLTNGIDPSTPEGLEASGLDKFKDYIEAHPDKYQVITTPLSSIVSRSDDLFITFADQTTLSVAYGATFPSRMLPPPEAAPLLTKDLLKAELTPMGGIAEGTGLPPLKFPPRMGEDPRTQVDGLYWAGNSGSPMANVNLAVQQGQSAALAAVDSLGEEDMEAMLLKK